MISKRKLRKILLGAKEIIKKRKSSFVCISILNFNLKYSSKHETNLIRKKIERMIDGFGTVGEWLENIHPIFYNYIVEKHNGDREEALREYRLAWIDHMIKEWC